MYFLNECYYHNCNKSVINNFGNLHQTKLCLKHYSLLFSKSERLSFWKERHKQIKKSVEGNIRTRKNGYENIELEEYLISKYGSEILKDYRKILNISSELNVHYISKKYNILTSNVGIIFANLYGFTLYEHFQRKKFWKKNRGKKFKQKKKEFRLKQDDPVLYKTCAKQLTIDEDPTKGRFGYLKVKCTYCGKYYYPKSTNVYNRISILNGNLNNGDGEYRLYCSYGCKQACPVYHRRWFDGPKEFKQATSREVQPELRQLVLKRDDYECQKCGNMEVLHCHHFEGIEQNPIESADVDMCITLCKECHKQVHRKIGCRRVDLTKYKLCA